MRAEIIAVGTELLLGDTVNTNASWLSKQLAALGVDVYYHTVVGDNVARLSSLLGEALARSDVLLLTGGLGPTPDDLTVSTLAQYFGETMVSDPDSEASIRAFFRERQMTMPLSNLKQALRPSQAEALPNPMGTAPGLYWDVSARVGKSTHVFCFPGVPRELYALWPQAEDRLLAIRRKAGEPTDRLFSTHLRFFGLGESRLAEILSDLMEMESPTVAPYCGQAEVKIRLAVKAESEQAAERQLAPVREEILARCGAYYFGDDTTTLEQVVGDLLRQQAKTVAVAESCTGGLVSSRLTDVAGSSAYVCQNLVVYSNQAKVQHLGVDPRVLEAEGAVSEAVAVQMAQGVCRWSGAQVGLSLTGIAGPGGGSPEKPVGLVYVGLAFSEVLPDEAVPFRTQVHRVQVNSHYARSDIKYWFSQYALQYLRQALLAPPQAACNNPCA
ncbi:MAG: competence/damage-inducible protein A [Candidatus Melainabacteria bacterium]|nr:competence/damage-inducible protein A [Candidatus Melainabacteria bacterium]